MKKSAVVCASLLVGLFGYTAISKLWQPHHFRTVPLLKTGAAALSVWLPLAELIVVLLLLFPATRLKEFKASLRCARHDVTSMNCAHILITVATAIRTG